jgi:twinkle protein
MQETQASFQTHSACEQCGSSDAKGIYEDGHAYCFACETYFGGNDEESISEGNPFAKIQATDNKEAQALYAQGKAQALKTRGITQETCKHFGYRVGNGKHLAPYRVNGKIVALKTRDADKNFSVVGDGKKLPLFGQHLQSKGKKLFVTEGELDALSLSQALGNRWPVVSVPNGAKSAPEAIRRELEYVMNFESVVFMFDQDAPGLEAAKACADLIEPGKAHVATLPLKDANQMLQEGQLKELVKAAWDAPVYRPDGIVAAKDLYELVASEDRVDSTAYPYDFMNEKTKGMRKGELVTITAGSGMGKSAFVRELAHHLVKEDERVGLLFLEENIKRTLTGLVSIELNKPLHIDREGVKQSDIRTAFNSVFGNGNVFVYDHFGSVSLEHIIAKLRYLAHGEQCSWIIIDHLSIMVSGLDVPDERKAIDVIMTRLRTFVEETGVGMLLVSHLRRPMGDKGFEEGAQVSLNSLRGSHSIGQLSDMVIGLERDQQSDSNETIVRVVKNRFTGATGRAGSLMYNEATGRLETMDAVGF